MKRVEYKSFFVVTVALLISTILFSNMTNATTVTPQHTDKADALYTLGLFQGTEKGYELDRIPTRVEGAVMLVRLLGKEKEILENAYSHPFIDVPEWASSYIGYLYSTGITKGLNSNQFGSVDALSSQQYAAFILRALGYGDFTWDASLDVMYKNFIINSDELQQLKSKPFLRDHTVLLSYYALLATMNSGQTLLEYLKSQHVIDEEQIVVSLINGPEKLDLSQLPEVKIIVPNSLTLTAFIDKTKLSNSMDMFHSFKIVSFNAKYQANQFETFINNPKNASHFEDRINELMEQQWSKEYNNVTSKYMSLTKELSIHATPFNTYVFLIYYDEKNRVYGYSDYFVPYNKVDNLEDEVPYPLDLNAIPKFENLYNLVYERELTIEPKLENKNKISLYFVNYVSDSVTSYQKQYGEIFFSLRFSTPELIDLNRPLNRNTLEKYSVNVDVFNNDTKDISLFNADKKYEYAIFFDYQFNTVGYTMVKIPK